MKRLVRTMFTMFVIVITIITIFDQPDYFPYQYDLIEETGQDIASYRYHKTIWDAENEQIDNDNEWLRKCKDGKRICKEYEKEKEYKENVPYGELWEDFTNDRPLWFITQSLWVVVLLLFYIFYDATFPRVYSVNSQGDRKCEGRIRYAIKRGKEAYFLGNPGLFTSWWKIWNMGPTNQYNVRIGTGTIHLTSTDSHRWHPHSNRYEIFSKQLEVGDDGYLYPGESSWPTDEIEIDDLKNIIDDELIDTEEMVRKGARANHSIRHYQLRYDGQDGHDDAEELLIDSREYQRRKDNVSF